MDYCYTQGRTVTTRNSTVKRVIGQTVELTDTPLVTLRKTAWKNAIREWEWFMSGSDNIKTLHDSVRHWWEPWADSRGRVKYNYSRQLRESRGWDEDGWPPDGGITVDQVWNMVDGLKRHPNSRRLILTTWNAAEMSQPDCPITNCHNTVTQAFVEDGRLRLVTYQRSCDLICGLPHNWIQMAAFQLWLCHQTGLGVDGLTWIGGDIHIYEAHYPIVEKMAEIDVEGLGPVPQLVYTPTSDVFKADDFTLSGEYKPVLTDRAEMVV